MIGLKIEAYSIKTGEFKDTGSPYRPMTSNERVLFQDLTNNLLEQFKRHLIEGRNMTPEDLEPYTDARIFYRRDGCIGRICRCHWHLFRCESPPPEKWRA